MYLLQSSTTSHGGLDADAAVRVTGLVCRLGAAAVLDGVDLAAPAGGLTVVLGANAAGKTTLLRVLATLVRPSAGEVRVAGADARRAPDAVRARVGVVMHQPLLYADLTVEENLRFFAGLYGLDDVAGRVAAGLEAVGLAARRRQPVGMLSRGMQQRLAIARAVIHDPAVLLLDEPYAGLDPAAGAQLDAVLELSLARGRTIVMTLHDLDRAAASADHIVFLRHGRVVGAGRPDRANPDGLRALYAAVDNPPPGLPPGGRGDRQSLRGRASVAEGGPSAGGRAQGRHLDTGSATDIPPVPAEHAIARDHAPARGAGFAATVRDIVAKDLRVELRAREIMPPVVMFALVVIVVFQFSLPRDAATGGLAGTPGAVWIALLFGSTLGLSRTVGAEVDGGGMTALLLAPVDRGALFTAKWLGGYVFSLLVAAALLPALVVWLNVAPASLPALAACLALGLAGWVAAGTLMAAIAVGTRAREVLLPVLLFPAVLPLLIPAVQATTALLGMDDGTAPVAALLTLMAAFDVIFFVLGFLLFPYTLEG